MAEYNNSGLLFVPSEISYSDYLDYWMEQYCKVNLSQNTCNNYAKKIRLHIKPELGMYKLKSLSSATIQDFINKKFNEGYSRNTLSVIRGMLVSSLDYATTVLEFIKYNPTHSVKLPLSRAIPNTPTRKKEKVVIPDEIIEKIFNRFPEGHPSYIHLLLGYACGLRLGEAFAIDLEKDIDYDNAELNINYQVQFLNGYWTLVPPKYNSCRSIKLDSFTLEKLNNLKNRHFESIKVYNEFYKQLKVNDKNQLNYQDGRDIHLLSTRDDGTYIQPRTINHVGRVVHYKFNFMEYDFHSLRHKHATMLLEAGANIKDVQERLGHKNIETTLQVYSHTTEKIKNSTVSLFENINILKK